MLEEEFIFIAQTCQYTKELKMKGVYFLNSATYNKKNSRRY